ncbi:MAG: precorrin-8X methylmutase [Candidatus Bathyarchaeia archaeon]
MDNVGLILVGHGSRNPQHKESVERLANIIRSRARFKIVETAYMVINTPRIEEAIEAASRNGAKKIVLIPVFMVAGTHTTRDIPKVLGLDEGERVAKRDGLEIIYGDPMGPDWRIAEIIEERAFQALALSVGENVDAGQPLTSTALFNRSIEKVRQVLGGFLENVPRNHAKIIERIVHATADPELGMLTFISGGAVDAGVNAIRAGAKVITDVKMVMAGINVSKLKKFGGKVECYVNEAEALRIAKEDGVTRAAAAMRLAVERGLDGAIVVIGNSPTAAFELASAVDKGEAEPALIIATPVGLIGAAEAKEAVMKLSVPHITIRGPRGGSSAAVAVFNALLELAESTFEGGQV